MSRASILLATLTILASAPPVAPAQAQEWWTFPWFQPAPQPEPARPVVTPPRTARSVVTAPRTVAPAPKPIDLSRYIIVGL